MIGKKKPAQLSLPPIELEPADLMSIPAPPRAQAAFDVDISFDTVPPAKPKRDDSKTSWENLELFNSASKVLAPPPVTGLFVEQKPNPLALQSLIDRFRTIAGQRRVRLGIATVVIAAAGSWFALPLARGTTQPKPTAAARGVATPSAPARRAEPARAEPKMETPAVAAAVIAQPVQPAATPTPAPAVDAPDTTATSPRTVKTSAAGKGKPARPEANTEAPAPARAEAPDLSQIPARAATPVPAAPAAPLPDVDVAGEFDRNAAMEALRDAGDASRSCLTAGAGGARVAVTFARSGGVSDVSVEPPLAGTPAGNCVAAKFRSLHVPQFRGSSVTVRKTISF